MEITDEMKKERVERRTLKLVPLNISMTFRNSTDDGEILHLMEQ